MSYLPDPWSLRIPPWYTSGAVCYDVLYDGQETNAMLLVSSSPVRSARLLTTEGARLDTTEKPDHETLRVWLRQFVEVVP